MEDTYLRELLVTHNNKHDLNMDTRSVTSKATSAYTINPTNHGEQRMTQRNISKKKIQEARKYGQKETSWNNRIIYRYNGLVYVTDSTSKNVITCYEDTNIPKISVKSYAQNYRTKELAYAIKHGQHDVLNKGFNHRYIVGNIVYITDSKSEKILEKYDKTRKNTRTEKHRRTRYQEKQHRMNTKVPLSTVKEEDKLERKCQQLADIHISKYDKYNSQFAPFLNKKGGLTQNYHQHGGYD